MVNSVTLCSLRTELTGALDKGSRRRQAGHTVCFQEFTVTTEFLFLKISVKHVLAKWGWLHLTSTCRPVPPKFIWFDCNLPLKWWPVLYLVLACFVYLYIFTNHFHFPCPLRRCEWKPRILVRLLMQIIKVIFELHIVNHTSTSKLPSDTIFSVYSVFFNCITCFGLHDHHQMLLYILPVCRLSCYSPNTVNR
jgi:hypothetical protein